MGKGKKIVKSTSSSRSSSSKKNNHHGLDENNHDDHISDDDLLLLHETDYLSNISYGDDLDHDLRSHFSESYDSVTYQQHYIEGELDNELNPKGDAGGFDLGEAVDMLVEKKINLREPALSSILNYLRSSKHLSSSSSTFTSSTFHSLNNYLETLINYCNRILRRPQSVKEACLSCKILCLLCLYIGPHDKTILTASEKPLLSIVDNSIYDKEWSELRIEVLFTYCFLVYIYDNEDKLNATLDYLENILNGEEHSDESIKHRAGLVVYSQEVKVKAIDCWVLLSSYLTEFDVLERCKDGEIFETITQLMENSFSNRLTMKISAGRAIAFMWETAHNFQCGLSFEQLGHLLCYNPRIVEQALNAIRNAIADSSKKVSKRNKKEQRAEFRDIEQWIYHHDFPIERIQMQGAEIEIDSFRKERIVQSLRHVLESGFQSSLRLYPVVMNILGVEFLTEDRGGLKAKVGKGSSIDKQRTKYLRQDRSHRDAELYSDYFG